MDGLVKQHRNVRPSSQRQVRTGSEHDILVLDTHSRCSVCRLSQVDLTCGAVSELADLGLGSFCGFALSHGVQGTFDPNEQDKRASRPLPREAFQERARRRG